MKQKLIDFILVTVGSFIASIGFNTMFVDNHIASGGMIGISVSLKTLFGLNPSIFLLCSNIPLLILCYFGLGRATFIKTLYGSWIYPIFIGLTEPFPTITYNPLLAAIFGGIIVGLGLGMVFLGNSSTGGTGIITQVIHKYTPLSLALAMTLADGFSVSLGFLAFDVDNVMYSIIGLGVISYVVSIMETGISSARNIMIVSPKHMEIKKMISSELDRGVTAIAIKGGYTDKNQVMLMSTVSRREVHRVEKSILAIDPTAFVIFTPASHVIGRGFSLTKKHEIIEEDYVLPR